ncbi:MAG: transcription elongation factor Spt5 [Candidatus Micrarchaeia archaeon]
MYFVAKVTSGQERVIANMLQNKASKFGSTIYSIIVVEGMRGYIIIEAEDEMACRNFITKEKNIHGILPKPLAEEEVNKLIEVKTLAPEIAKDDTIEFVSGPFKGYKAKVIKVDEAKGDVTVELMDVVVPIPITTKLNTARVVEKAHVPESEKV